MAFKVEYAKFNVLSNPIRTSPLVIEDGGNLRNIATTTATSGDFVPMNIHHYDHGFTPNNFTDPYQHQAYPGMFNHDSSHSYSPMSSTSSNTNELNYQNNASMNQLNEAEYNVNNMYAPVISTEINETNTNNAYPLANAGYSDVQPSFTTASRGIYGNETGVVYTTLTDCRFGENQPLNLPNQPVADYTKNYAEDYSAVNQESQLDN